MKNSTVLYSILVSLLLAILFIFKKSKKMKFREKVKQTAQKYGYPSEIANAVYAQALLESAKFTSNVFKENNNPFGLKQPKVRKTTATGSNRGHATFNSVSEAITDYFLRQTNFRVTYQNDEQYINDTFNSKYAEDQKYKTKWLTLLVQVEQKAFDEIEPEV